MCIYIYIHNIYIYILYMINVFFCYRLWSPHSSCILLLDKQGSLMAKIVSFLVAVLRSLLCAHQSPCWWFGTFVIFPYIGNNHPNWLIFLRGVGIPPRRLLLLGISIHIPLLSTIKHKQWMLYSYSRLFSEDLFNHHSGVSRRCFSTSPGACEEGAEIGHSQRCTAFCAAGYVPSVPSLECYETWFRIDVMWCR